MVCLHEGVEEEGIVVVDGVARVGAVALVGVVPLVSVSVEEVAHGLRLGHGVLGERHMVDRRRGNAVVELGLLQVLLLARAVHSKQNGGGDDHARLAHASDGVTEGFVALLREAVEEAQVGARLSGGVTRASLNRDHATEAVRLHQHNSLSADGESDRDGVVSNERLRRRRAGRRRGRGGGRRAGRRGGSRGSKSIPHRSLTLGVKQVLNDFLRTLNRHGLVPVLHRRLMSHWGVLDHRDMVINSTSIIVQKRRFILGHVDTHDVSLYIVLMEDRISPGRGIRV